MNITDTVETSGYDSGASYWSISKVKGVQYWELDHHNPPLFEYQQVTEVDYICIISYGCNWLSQRLIFLHNSWISLWNIFKSNFRTLICNESEKQIHSKTVILVMAYNQPIWSDSISGLDQRRILSWPRHHFGKTQWPHAILELKKLAYPITLVWICEDFKWGSGI